MIAFAESVLAYELALTIAQFNAQSSSFNAALALLASTGVSPSMVATGAYGWSNLNVEVDGSTLPPMNNAQCSLFMTLQTQSVLKAELEIELAKTLPILATGISIWSDVTCGPALPLQTREDQHAYFIVNGLKIQALYTMFPNSAYVTYVTSVDHYQQLPELKAPLSQNNVSQALQDALRRVFLDNLQTYYSNQLSSLTSQLPSASSGGLPIIVLAAAAGGAIVLILLVLIIFVIRRRRQANPFVECNCSVKLTLI